MSLDHIIESLDKRHIISEFNCRVKELDIYLKERASQEVKKKITAVYVIRPKNSQKIIGYYTLSSFSIELTDLPAEIAKKLPKYPLLPASLIGRLAVDKNFQNKNIGSHLLIDALIRSYRLSKQIGSFAVIVDAKNKKIKKFYEKYGFKQFKKHSLKLYLPMKIIKELI